MIFINDINDSRISEFRQMKILTVNGYYINQFIADGDKIVLKALNSDLKIYKLFAKEDFINENIELISSKVDSNNIFTADKQFLNEIVGFRLHTGVLALVEMPEPNKIEELDNQIVVFNNIERAENTAAIIRSGVGFGFNSYIFDDRSCHPYSRKSVRISMASVFKTKYHITDNLLESLEYLKSINYEIIAVEIHKNSINLNNYKFNSKIVLIFGSESYGIDSNILNFADKIIEIPITSNIDSLNVNSSSAIVFNKIFNDND